MEKKQNPLVELSVVILCYRAGESTREFVNHTICALESAGIIDYELILVGNYLERSGDITPDIVKDIASKNLKIRYVADVKQGMMGWDMKSGLNLAAGNYLMVIDGDSQMPVEDLARVFLKIQKEKLDLVKVYRVKRGDDYWRKTISLIYNIFFHLLFPGLKARDINAKPKIFTREAYEKMHLVSDDWFIDAEIMIQARRLRLRVGEIPTIFLGLTGRRSFVHPRAILEFLKNLIRFRIKEAFY